MPTLINEITVDGTAGSGTSSFTEALAAKLNELQNSRWSYLSSGSIYRALAWYMIEKCGCKLTDEDMPNLLTETLVKIAEARDHQSVHRRLCRDDQRPPRHSGGAGADGRSSQDRGCPPGYPRSRAPDSALLRQGVRAPASSKAATSARWCSRTPPSRSGWMPHSRHGQAVEARRRGALSPPRSWPNAMPPTTTARTAPCGNPTMPSCSTQRSPPSTS